MDVKKLQTDQALDLLVTDWVQGMEDVHYRCVSRIHSDPDAGDQFMTIYDPVTDRCLTVWLSPSRFGHEVLEMARTIISSFDSKKGGRL